MDEKASKITVAAFADFSWPCFATSRIFPWCDTKPGGKLPARCEVLRIPDRGDDELALNLVEGCGHMKKQASFGGAGVNILGEHLGVDVTGLHVLCSLDDLFERTRQARELPDDVRIIFS